MCQNVRLFYINSSDKYSCTFYTKEKAHFSKFFQSFEKHASISICYIVRLYDLLKRFYFVLKIFLYEIFRQNFKSNLHITSHRAIIVMFCLILRNIKFGLMHCIGLLHTFMYNNIIKARTLNLVLPFLNERYLYEIYLYCCYYA